MELPQGVFSNKKEESRIEKPEEKFAVNGKVNISSNKSGSGDSGRRKKSPKLSWVQWLIIMLIYCVPIVNIIECIVLIIKDKYQDGKRWAKGAIIVASVLSLIIIIACIRFKNMPYADFMKFYKLFHK